MNEHYFHERIHEYIYVFFFYIFLYIYIVLNKYVCGFRVSPLINKKKEVFFVKRVAVNRRTK